VIASAGPVGPAPSLARQTVQLRESRRFDGPIGELALAVNRGDLQAARHCLAGPPGGPLYGLEGASPAEVLQLALHGRPGAEGGYRPYLQRLARPPAVGDAGAHADWVRAVLRDFDGFRLLCAVREGEWGAAGLNRAVQQALAGAGLLRPQGEWYAGRPVMVTRNDPALGVYNGDIGIALPPASGLGLRVWFDDGPKPRSVGAGRLAQVETAFAMTVHKSQGSEFGHSVLVLPAQGGAGLSRELVYTGITRARRAFSLISGQASALALALAQPTRRASGLPERLRD
jgi:exodeoxyribonuclease V alpha subunit